MENDEVVSLEYRVKKSFEGKYFIGHTPVLAMYGYNAWAGLFNPGSSKVNLYINTFTITNYSSAPFPAQLWLNSSPEGKRMTSSFVSPANTAKVPPAKPEAYLLYSQNVTSPPSNGVSILTRISGANSTEVGNYYGKIIIPPGGSFIVFLYSPGAQLANAEVAFGWWEDK